MKTTPETIVLGAVSILLMIFVLVGNNNLRLGQMKLQNDMNSTRARIEMVKLDELRSDLDYLKTAVSEIRNNVNAMSQGAQARPQQPAQPQQQRPPQAVEGEVALADFVPTLGSGDAKVVMIEFTDFQCPFCKRFFNDSFPSIKSSFVAEGKLMFAFVDNPLPMHPRAGAQHQAAHCAGDQDKYWQYHTLIYENQTREGLEPDALKALAVELDLDAARFNECLDSGKHAERVQWGVRTARSVGATGTPAFLIGVRQPDGKIKGNLVRGALPFNAFQSEINKFLEQ